jgi:two-component system NtrC family sensor kinase
MGNCPHKNLSFPVIIIIVGAVLCPFYLWHGLFVIFFGIISSVLLFFYPACLEGKIKKTENINFTDEQQARMAQLGQLSAGIAHEIKNPLNFIKNFSLLTKELTEEIENTQQKEIFSQNLQQIKENLDRITQNAERAEHTVLSILQQASSNQSELSLTNVNTLLDEYYRFAYHATRAQYPNHNISLKQIFANNLPLIKINQPKIGRVFLNIINNALYTLRKKQEKNKNFIAKLELSTKIEDDYILISIKDNGEGINKENQKKIMQCFFTTKPKSEGTGLGLSICNDIIKEHHGMLEISSEPDMYTKFTIKLPVGTK